MVLRIYFVTSHCPRSQSSEPESERIVLLAAAPPSPRSRVYMSVTSSIHSPSLCSETLAVVPFCPCSCKTEQFDWKKKAFKKCKRKELYKSVIRSTFYVPPSVLHQCLCRWLRSCYRNRRALQMNGGKSQLQIW